MSSLTMTCNSSGWSNPSRGAQFGIASYDWSNAKTQWAAAKPMDCEERLLEQAEMTKRVNPDTHVFVYRNLVKALVSGYVLAYAQPAHVAPYHLSLIHI